MKTITHIKSTLLAAVLGLSFAGAAQATISLTNGSFETANVGSGTTQYFLTAGTPSGWTQWNGGGTGNGYQRNYSAGLLSSEYGGNALPDGNQVLGLGRGGSASVYQDLGTVTAGESYIFSGYLGRPATDGVNPTGGYIMQLSVGTSWGADTAILTLNNGSVSDPTAGTWVAWSGTSSVITEAQNGQHLYAFLYGATGAWPSNREFDNLSVTTVPEPSTILAVLGGAGMLAMFRRRRS
jgi:hypothetical protein